MDGFSFPAEWSWSNRFIKLKKGQRRAGPIPLHCTKIAKTVQRAYAALMMHLINNRVIGFEKSICKLRRR